MGLISFGKLIIPTMIFIYLLQYVPIKTYNQLFNLQKSSILVYNLPIIISMTLSILILLSKKISTKLYRIIFIISDTYFAIVFYIFLFTSIYQILRLIFGNSLNNLISLSITVIIPPIVILKGICNTQAIHTEYVCISNKKIEKTIKIAHISDLHLGAFSQKYFVQNVVDKLQKLNADLIVITGDLFDMSYKVESECLSPFKTLTSPILFITGNHDVNYGEEYLNKVLSENNIIFLNNSVYNYKGNINFIGLNYNVSFPTDKLNEIININEELKNKNKVNILLNHCPDLYPQELEKFNIFLMLSGHTHGGQFYPFHYISKRGSKCFRGLNVHNYSNYVYVTNGLGFSIIPIRLFANSTISIISLIK